MIARSTPAADHLPPAAPAMPPSLEDQYRAVASEIARSRPGLAIERLFTDTKIDPLDAVTWEIRDAVISGADGRVFFEQRAVEFPAFWSQKATDVVAQKYFRGQLGTPQRERSARAMIARVARTIHGWGVQGGYFRSEGDAGAFRDELIHLLLHQKMAFNSPVWFNVGVDLRPQCSACFINSVDDSMGSILDLAKTEATLFKHGSGTGSNLSTLRGSCERLSGGGIASGPISFMRGLDAFAGAIKSGGKTRRAAKMVILNVDHPDIVEFVQCKAAEEGKARALIDAGYDGRFNVAGGAYDSVHYQNANHSVRVTDDFMRAVLADDAWTTRNVVGGEAAGTYRARDLMRRMATAAWECGDPGVQFDTTINQWHTCPESGRISASNPCSEYMFLDDSACNLASLNLRAFQDPETGDLDVESFRHAVQITVLAMEILVDSASYPTARIADHSRQFRPLGLGYANLGALLMSGGLPYDSDAGRALAAAITALMSGEAYRMSALIARDAGGAFDGYPENSQPFLDVMCRHLDACDELVRRDVQRAWSSLLQAARNSWGEAIAMGQLTGFRNAQATVLAPTGTIAFLMDCDTTGIEPDIAIVKRKELVGGGEMRIVNGTVPEALRRLGYDPAQVDAIVRHADARGTVEGAPGLRDEHLPAFDCALRAGSGTRSISYMGHIKMMAAVQPFLSGAISKTVNLPADCTVVDVEDAYIQAWRLGLKSIAVYRDGCKRTQPLSAGAGPDPAAPGPNLGSGADPIGGGTVAAADDPDYRLSAEERGAVDAIRALRRRPAGPPVANRHKLPTERPSRTHKFSVGGHEGYVTVGMYQDGSPGEIFVRMAKEGSSIAGLMDSFATAISLSLQHGVPLQLLVDKFRGTRFEPSGFTGNQEIPIATSIMDYLFRWLAVRFPATEDRGPVAAGGPATSAAPAPADDSAIFSGAQISGHRSMPRNDGPLPENVDVAEDRRVFASLSDQADRAFLLEEIRSPRSDRQNSRRVDSDAPPCPDCGTLMVRSGACRRCPNCGSTSGCS